MLTPMRSKILLSCLPLLLSLTTGCATPVSSPSLLVFGEQHDQPDQQRQVAEQVRALAAEGRLAAVVLEMAERGRDTRALPADASQAQVREALAWTGWPWEAYAEVVMSAVQARVPVLGGNHPRADMRAAMADPALDAQVPAAARARLAAAVREGHCKLLPEAQEPGMVRVQIARDRALAATAQQALAAAAPGQLVLMLTGAQHASRDRGLPLHLGSGTALRVVMFGDGADGLLADERRPFAMTPRPDPCEEFRRQRQGAG
jgi:uncharacterized iron-regulated protein